MLDPHPKRVNIGCAGDDLLAVVAIILVWRDQAEHLTRCGAVLEPLMASWFLPFAPSGGKSRHLPPPRGACAATIQCYYVPVVSNAE
jgi:hypothetical protein